MKTLAGLALAGLTACGAESGVGPSRHVISSAQEESMKLTALALPLALATGPIAAQSSGVETCAMHIEQKGDLMRAVYDTPEPCGSLPPRWVAIDFWVEYVQMETMNYPNGRRADCSEPTACNVGFYMRPVNFAAWVPSLPGQAYAIQARSSDGGGRATVYVTWTRGGVKVSQ